MSWTKSPKILTFHSTHICCVNVCINWFIEWCFVCNSISQYVYVCIYCNTHCMCMIIFRIWEIVLFSLFFCLLIWHKAMRVDNTLLANNNGPRPFYLAKYRSKPGTVLFTKLIIVWHKVTIVKYQRIHFTWWANKDWLITRGVNHCLKTGITVGNFMNFITSSLSPLE